MVVIILHCIQVSVAQSPGWEDLLEKRMDTHSNILGEYSNSPGEFHGLSLAGPITVHGVTKNQTQWSS